MKTRRYSSLFRARNSTTAVACIVFMAGSALLHATDYTWVPTSGNDWANAANWTSSPTGGGFPTSGAHRIQIGTGGSSNTYSTRAIYSTAQGENTFAGGTSSRTLVIGNGGTGHMEISGGTFISTSGDADIMANSGGNGFLYITGGTYQKLAGSGISGTFMLNYSNGTSRLEIGGTGTFTVTTLDFQGSTGGSVGTTGTIQLNTGGTLSLQYFTASNTVSGTRTVNLNGGTITSLGNATWGDISGVSWNLQSASRFNIGHSVTLLEPLSGTGGFTKSGSGNLTLSNLSSASNTYTGQTIVSEGILTVGNNNALGATGAGNNTSASGGGRVVLANSVTVTGEVLSIAGVGDNNGALQAASNATATWAGDIIVNSADDTRIGSGTGGNLIITGNIDATASTSGLGIRSAGNDTTTGTNFDNTMVTLGGTYTGSALRIYQGVVKLGASERIQNSAGLILGHNVSTALKQRFDLNGFNETVAYVAVDATASSAAHEITNSSATASKLTLDSSGANRTFSGIVTGNLAIEKLGSNAVTFSGVNTYTGNTTVGAGTFNVADGGALNGGTSLSVASGATFNLNTAATLQFNIGDNGVNNAITGAGTVNLNGIFNLNLASASLVAGNAWDLVEATGTINRSGLQVTSTSGAFSKTDNIWTLVNGGLHWEFNENTGILSLVSIPEPSHALLSILGGAALSLRRRRNGKASRA